MLMMVMGGGGGRRRRHRHICSIAYNMCAHFNLIHQNFSVFMEQKTSSSCLHYNSKTVCNIHYSAQRNLNK